MEKVSAFLQNDNLSLVSMLNFSGERYNFVTCHDADHYENQPV